MELSEWVREARAHKKLTQQRLGDSLGVSKSNISGWEKARHKPSYKQVQAISKLTGYAPPAATEGTDAPRAPPVLKLVKPVSPLAEPTSAELYALQLAVIALFTTSPARKSLLSTFAGIVSGVHLANEPTGGTPPEIRAAIQRLQQQLSGQP